MALYSNRLLRFLELNEIQEWCAQRAIELDARGGLPTDADFFHAVEIPYASGHRSGRERTVAAACLRALGPWDESLLWVTQTGIWSSGEDWPTYYALRGRMVERRSIDVAPGHWFAGDDEGTLLDFLTLVFENAWDAFVLPSHGGRKTGRRLLASHDEYVLVQSATRIEPDALAV